jgi:hypothetical protein
MVRLLHYLSIEKQKMTDTALVDGDLVDETTPTSRTPAGPESLHIWGPPLPDTFLQ